MKDNDSQSGESTYDSAKSNYERIYGSSGKFDDFWDTRLNSFSNRGKGHPDFTHQSITMATHLNPAWVQLSDIYGGGNTSRIYLDGKEIRLKMPMTCLLALVRTTISLT